MLKKRRPICLVFCASTSGFGLKTAEQIEADLGEEKSVFFDGSEQDWEAQPPPDGPMTVGIDGGFVRAAHKEGFFEVIAGKSVVDFRRSAEEATSCSKCLQFRPEVR
ncbi:MAG: hypothetical protein JO334_19690 [Verrucomicrobia bacterium]|nr:hypothetical protein [Verrucomicrobiota bacterium]